MIKTTKTSVELCWDKEETDLALFISDEGIPYITMSSGYSICAGEYWIKDRSELVEFFDKCIKCLKEIDE